VKVQQAAYATDVPSDIYTFHRSTGNSACLYFTQVDQYQTQNQVKPENLTNDLKDRLRTLYTQ